MPRKGRLFGRPFSLPQPQRGFGFLSAYLCAGLPRYWIIDVKERSVIEFTQPWQAGYCSERRLRQGDRLALGEVGSPLEGLTIDVSDLIS